MGPSWAIAETQLPCISQPEARSVGVSIVEYRDTDVLQIPDPRFSPLLAVACCLLPVPRLQIPSSVVRSASRQQTNSYHSPLLRILDLHKHAEAVSPDVPDGQPTRLPELRGQHVMVL